MDEFRLAYNGWLDSYKDEWERTRLICYYSSIGSIKPKPIDKFMPFVWDKHKIEKAVPDREAFERMVEKYNKIKENNNGR